MHRISSIAFPSFAAICGFAVAQADAAVIGIDDFSGDETVIGFDGGIGGGSSFTIGNVTVEKVADVTFSIYQWGEVYFDHIEGASGGNAVAVGGGSEVFKISFATPVTRAGLLLANDLAGNIWTVSAYDSDESELGSHEFTMDTGGEGIFAGFEFSTPIVSLIISDAVFDSHGTFFDDVRFEQIPEPATLMLLLAGATLMLGRPSI